MTKVSEPFCNTVRGRGTHLNSAIGRLKIVGADAAGISGFYRTLDDNKRLRDSAEGVSF